MLAAVGDEHLAGRDLVAGVALGLGGDGLLAARAGRRPACTGGSWGRGRPRRRPRRCGPGVGKSGSPAPKPMTGSPGRLQRLGLGVDGQRGGLGDGGDAARRRGASVTGGRPTVSLLARTVRDQWHAMTARCPPPTSRSPPTCSPPTAASAAAPPRSGPRRSTALAGAGRDYLGTSPPPGPGAVRGRRAAQRAGRAVRPARRLRGRCSATAAPPSFWDAATFGLIERRSQHLALRRVLVQVRRRPPRPRRTSTSRRPHRADPGHRTRCPVADADVDVYCLTHNETSTGVAMPLAPARRRRPGLVLVDATSAAGGLRFDPNEVDVYYFAPQKCLASDGGLWLAAVSPAAVERIERIAASRPLDARRRSTSASPSRTAARTRPTTPRRWPRSSSPCSRSSGSTSNGGLEWAAGRCDRSAETIYGWAEALDLRHAVRGRPGAAQPRGRHHRPRRRRRRHHRVARCCGPTASSTPRATASSAATSCASRCSRPSTPTTSPPSPAASTTSWPPCRLLSLAPLGAPRASRGGSQVRRPTAASVRVLRPTITCWVAALTSRKQRPITLGFRNDSLPDSR